MLDCTRQLIRDLETELKQVRLGVDHDSRELFSLACDLVAAKRMAQAEELAGL